MITPYDIAREAAFDASFDPSMLTFDQDRGFLEVQSGQISIDELDVVGFAMPYARTGGYDMDSEYVKPITDLKDVPKEFRKVDLQGKGVGTRVFNAPEAAASVTDQAHKIGVYTFSVDPEKILDFRGVQGGKVVQVLRHARRMAKEKLGSLEAVVDDIHAQYQGYDAVLMDVPPHGLVRMKMRGVQQPEGLTPSFMIIRSAAVTLERIGELSLYSRG